MLCLFVRAREVVVTFILNCGLSVVVARAFFFSEFPVFNHGNGRYSVFCVCWHIHRGRYNARNPRSLRTMA